jgi:YfiH family protein
LVTVFQVHSAEVVNATEPFASPAPKADAIVSNTKGLAIGILTADCAPILFCDPDAGVVGAAHSGWQGALKGNSSRTKEKMVELGASTSSIQAIVGPCISQRNYEVGEEFFERFQSENSEFTRFFGTGHDGKYHFDLPGFCLHSLREAGVGNAEWTGHCTYADMDKFYSYRRATHMGEPDYGRLISVIAP